MGAPAEPDESLEVVDGSAVLDVVDELDGFAASVVGVCEPIDPETPITPKAMANVASAVAATRRRIARSRTARARSRWAAISRGVEVGSAMSTMVPTEPKDGLNGACELPETRFRRGAQPA
jgi:DNA invertase Pin-like site-specific DNA recombinase